jgi:hypothetical protein
MTHLSDNPSKGAAAATAAPRAGRLVTIEPEGFADAFARRPFPVEHHLVDHPLLTLEGIAELADALPLTAVERHRADLPLVMPGGAPDLDGRPSDTVRTIETNNCWIVLWNVEQMPAWRALLHDCLDDVEAHIAGRDGGMIQRQGFLFLSAPNALTPAHFDPEHNLLLQVRGTKEMTVARFSDPADQHRELDRYYEGGHRNLESVPVDAQTFVLSPGRGVYVDSFAPHWVRNRDAVSISLSITFRTRRSEAVERAHALNARLRRLGLHPRPAGHDERRDRAKAAIVHGADRVRQLRERALERRRGKA